MRLDEKKQRLHSYVKACDEYFLAHEKVQTAVRLLGSDPLGVLESAELPTEVTPEDPKIGLTDAGPEQVEVVEEESDEKESYGSYKGGELQFNRPSDKRRFEENVQWLYKQLAGGPLPADVLKLRAQNSGKTWYAVNKARRYTSDIKVRIVGVRGVHHWYVDGQEHLIPSVEESEKQKKERKAATRNKLNANTETKLKGVLTPFGDTFAGVVGKTQLKADEVRHGLGILQLRGEARFDSGNKMWYSVK